MRSTAVFKEEVEVEAAVCSIATLIIHISLSVRIFVLLSVPFVAMHDHHPPLYNRTTLRASSVLVRVGIPQPSCTMRREQAWEGPAKTSFAFRWYIV